MRYLCMWYLILIYSRLPSSHALFEQWLSAERQLKSARLSWTSSSHCLRQERCLYTVVLMLLCCLSCHCSERLPSCWAFASGPSQVQLTGTNIHVSIQISFVKNKLLYVNDFQIDSARTPAFFIFHKSALPRMARFFCPMFYATLRYSWNSTLVRVLAHRWYSTQTLQ